MKLRKLSFTYEGSHEFAGMRVLKATKRVSPSAHFEEIRDFKLSFLPFV
ncbi:hypothetical protein L1279_002558 [Planomicrobium sp. HSC-17F08]|nr:hypothetical protein [Planomicrobium sp. HSC-17F08]